MCSAPTTSGWADHAVIHRSRGSHDTIQLMWRPDLLKPVLDHVPPYVWRDYAGVDPRAGA